jgi:hypothetical protein
MVNNFVGLSATTGPDPTRARGLARSLRLCRAYFEYSCAEHILENGK